MDYRQNNLIITVTSWAIRTLTAYSVVSIIIITVCDLLDDCTGSARANNNLATGDEHYGN